MKSATVFFGVQLLSYFIVNMGIRALAQANVPWTLSLDALTAALNFTVIRRIAKSDDGWINQVAYIAGSVLGTWASIAVSVRVFGK